MIKKMRHQLEPAQAHGRSRDMFQTTDLVPLLAERGIHLSRRAGVPAGHPAAPTSVDGHSRGALRHPGVHPRTTSSRSRRSTSRSARPPGTTSSRRRQARRTQIRRPGK